MNTTTRFTTMIKKMVLPLVACSMMCATHAYAADPGDIIGFYSTSANSEFKTPGTTVEFTIRLAGTIVVSNLFNTALVQPQIRMTVGSEGSSSTAYATLVRTAWITAAYEMFNRTDLTFAYTIRPGDMADPLRIYGTQAAGFTIAYNQCWIYKAYPGNITSNVTWKVNNALYDQPGSNGYDSGAGVSLGDYDLSTQQIKLLTLSFDALNASTLIARAPATTWRINSGATNATAVKVMVWTPHTNLLQIGTSPNQALEVTIPAGMSYADFPVKGLNTNAIPTYAMIYAQRPSDYKPPSSTTNSISSQIQIDTPGEPTIALEFPNGMSSQTLAETNELETGSFRIVLSETHTNRVYVNFSITNQPSTANNIIITPQPGGYFVAPGQEKSGLYTFSVKDGTRESARLPYVRINPYATNTAKYVNSSAGIFNVANVAPTVKPYFPSTGDEGTSVAFEWEELVDVDADLAKGITFKWNFGDGTRITETHTNKTLGSISHTYSGLIGDVATPYTVTLTIQDTDGGSYTLPEHKITISPAPKPANVSVVVNRADSTYPEGDLTAKYKVVLSAPALTNTYITLKGQYLEDNSSSDDCLTLTVTNVFIATGLTSSVPYAMTIKDGTAKTANGIQIIPTITNAAARAQYPGAYSGYVIIENIAPGIDANPTCLPTTAPIWPYNSIEMNKPFTFKYTATDVMADKTGSPPIRVEYQFADDTTTNVTGVTGSATKTFTSLGRQTVTMIARDKDGGETTLAFPIQVIAPLPIPSVTVVDYPVFISENDTTAKQLTVQLSQTPISAGITDPVVVYLDVTPTNSPINGAVTIPASVTIFQDKTTKTFNFTVQDGTRLSAIGGFTVTPRIATTNAAAFALYKDIQPGQVLVQNVAPVILMPIDQSTNMIATVGQPRAFTWNVKDVVADSPTMNLLWDWGDGTTSTTIGGSGTTNHTYQVASPQVAVTVTATDKDGDFTMISFYVNVKDSKQVIALPIGPNNAGFNGLTELGTGTIISVNPLASPTLEDAAGRFYTFYYPADRDGSVLLRAIPTPPAGNPPFSVPRRTDGKRSYFFAWDGPLAAFQNTKHVTQPLAPETTMIVLPTGTAGAANAAAAAGNTTLAGTMVQISAIFTLAYSADDAYSLNINNGDLNQDGIPDRFVQRYFADPTAAGGNGTTLDAVWFENLTAYNVDEDFLPVYPTGNEQGVIDFRPIPNPDTAANGVAVNAFTAFMEIRGDDGVLGLFEGQDDDPGTDPTMNDSDGDTYPDGWEYWFWFQSNINGRQGSRFDPKNIAQGTVIPYSEIVEAFAPTRPRSSAVLSRASWLLDFDNDGLLDIEELVLGTDPTNWDTDGDIMADGWEIIRGFNPCDIRDGALTTFANSVAGFPASNNPDGDYFAISTVQRQLIQVVTSNETQTSSQETIYSISTNNYLVAVSNNVRNMATLTTAYHYGDDTAPWAVGIAADSNVLAVANQITGPAPAITNALIMHFQVRNEYKFDPRTAWVGTVGRFAADYTMGNGPPTGWPYAAGDRFGAWGVLHAPNTRPFTAVDEYLLMKFMYELQLNGMPEWIANVDTAIANNESTRLLVQQAWSQYTTHPFTPDTDATPGLTDGVPDGWELYVATNPAGGNAFAHSPWVAEPGTAYQREYWGTDSLIPYQDPNLYRFGMTDLNPMIGIVTIIRPVGDADTYWVNKFWPTDPWSGDTDGDGIDDFGERAFMYGNAVDNGGTCIAGGGLNPNSVDTDRDALPDDWEAQFAGTPVAADGTTTLPAVLPGQPAIAVAMTITNGQDGTVADAGQDWDLDGLLNYEEYMTQALRCYRYDVPDGAVPNDATVTDPFTGYIGQPMNITFEIGAFFTEVATVWDQCRLGWPGAAPLWWMRPAGPNGYCSTDPQNPDTDYDNMDDYYEMFHGLNPLLGNGIRADCLDDRVAYAWIVQGAPLVTYSFNWWMFVQPGTIGFSMDFVRYPWLNGMPTADPDADGLLNLEEMLAVNMPLPENRNTDPSPIWMTDPSNTNSLTARFYTPYGYTGYKTAGAPLYRSMFFWPATIVPYFTYQFEMNEGYDTDNDGISDKDEQVTNRNAKSDPRDSEDPIRRQAIWFSGTNSAATTPYMYTDLSTIVGQSFLDMEQAFRSFTVELWARPEWATNRIEQTLIERAFDYGQSDASQPAGEQRLRRNFLIGIAPDGRVFGGFDNAGGHDAHTDSVRLYGEKIVSNTWVHLAARMDGRTEKFTLFVNGVSQGDMSTSLIPATGLDPIRYYPTQPGDTEMAPPRTGTLILGAANIELVSIGIGVGFNPTVHPNAMTWDATWAGYEKFYRGWMDEVRVWDGARSNKEINDNFRKRFTRDDLIANRTQILEELNNGASRNAFSTNNFLSPILLNYYTFNNLFSANSEQYVAQVPRGFNSSAVNTNRFDSNPASSLVKWWDASEVKNTVYNNWHYLPWIENVPAHLPLVTMLTSTNGATTFVNDDVVTDSIYWTRRAAGNLEAQNSFPNSNNPYGFLYSTIRTIDLLPIGNAWAKQCVDFWDDQGASGNWLENSGTTDDGLPAWWITLHGTTGGWNDLYTGTNAYYKENGMTNGEVYQRDLAKGMLQNAASTSDYNALYAQIADSNGDGMPDWWKRIYGLSLMDKTGENGPLGDPDKDGLVNYAEYQITEVYKFRYSNPLKFKTNPAQPVSDYFMKATGGKLTMGAMFSDHDFIEDWWEELYLPGAANPYVYDSKTDYDSDGWSNWAEARYSQAISTVRPDLRELVMVNAITTYEFPIPTVETRLNYRGVQESGDVVIQAFSTPAMDGVADATWNIAFGQAGVQANTLPLGFYADKTIRTRLSPGSVVPGTIHVQLTDTWTGVTDITAFDMDGVIYSMLMNNVWEPIGTINYITGEMVFDMGYFANINIVLDEATYPDARDSYIDSSVSYFEMTYDTKLPNGWPQRIYLGRAATGALKEGKNYFYAFIDVDGSGTWDAGEPAGIGTPFETDIGWDENTLDIQLTDYTPNNLRLSLATGLRSEDVIFGTAQPAAGGGGQQAAAVGSYNRVRIVRATVQTSNFTEGPIFDKTIFGRDYIHEGDLMTMPIYAGYGFDWGFKGVEKPYLVGAISYKVYVGDQDVMTNNTLVATFTNKFDGARAVATSILPKHGAYVYTERPTFTWSVTSQYGGYNAFAFEIRRGSTSGALVYPITVRQVPLKDTATDTYIWEAPFYMGDKNVVNNGVYYWRIQMLNPRYSTTNTVAAEWSSWKIFRWDVNQTLSPAGTSTNLNGSSSGYGQLRAVVKYFGAASNLADRVILQAFHNRGFTGFPAGQFTYAASQVGLITNLSLSATNAIALRGLMPDTYYVRAFIDSNTNSVLDSWESWGYANYYGETKSIYDVRPIDVSYSATSPLVTVYMEDSDTDQDWFPDAYEYELNTASTNFLELTGPNDAWSYRGDSEINPNLNTGSFMSMMMSMVSGSSAQQDAIFNLAVDPSSSKTTTTLPAVTIQKLDFAATGATLDWDLTPGQTTTTISSFQALFQRAPAATTVSVEKNYTYRVRFSASLETARSAWAIVKEDAVTVDANGTKTITSVINNMPAAGTSGFFYVEIE